MDAVYLVCYDGVHSTNVIFATTNEIQAIDEANKLQGFRVEKWENGKKVIHKFYDGSITGVICSESRDTGHRFANEA